MITRTISTGIERRLSGKKAIIIMGARQVGKTTLLKMIMEDKKEVLWLNGDENDVQVLFENSSSARLRAYFGNAKYIVIDEAQRIPDVGLRLKIIIDQIEDVKVIASGSSSFDLASEINEPLTGRKWEFMLFPISFDEMVRHHGLLEEKRMLRHRLVYGYYPDIVNNQGDEKGILKQLTDSYLYRDLLIIDQIKKPDNLVKLLRALAWQTGSQVSFHELSQVCGLDPKTVEKYVDLLEKTYVIFRLNSFSRNLRNELKKSRKLYFWDNGIRNSLINNFQQFEVRQDKGALWENFLVSERMKYLNNSDFWVNCWYWRTMEQKEIDLIEEKDGILTAYEFKINPEPRYKIPRQFKEAYPAVNVKLIHSGNLESFITDMPPAPGS
jgi:predicted AAA+ superfamily ATPase